MEPATTCQQPTYDNAGLLLTHRKAKGSTINFNYDVRHRRTAEKIGAVAFAAYGYDLAGRLLTASNSDAVMTRTYDLTGRLTSKRQQHLNGGAVAFDTTVSRGYEASGMLSSVTDAFGTTDYVYNQRGLLKDVNVDGPPPAYTFTYDNVGRRLTGISEIGVPRKRDIQFILRYVNQLR